MEEAWNGFNLMNQVDTENVNIVSSVFKLLLSMVLGAMVGLERRHKGQIAGMRTFALICMGATLAMLVSIYIPEKLLNWTYSSRMPSSASFSLTTSQIGS